ncbi:MAG: XrtA system polysaccharide deacetylase [Desulfobaccales bacterium]
MINFLTIDVEDWFHTSALDPYIGPEQWDHLAPRVVANVQRLLEILASHQTRATFFILGWVAERFPELVREIDALGHEICSHGYRHRLIYHLAPAQFKDFLQRSKQILEDIVGKPVRGYRATSFSIVQKTLWALDLIREAGFIYDSSIFPVSHHDIYGLGGCPRFPFKFENGLIEIPPSTIKIFGRNIPLGGGGYFRLYPYWMTRLGIRRINREGYPAMVYLHPWELDPQCPRVTQANSRTRFRQYINLTKTEGRLHQLLSEFTWQPARNYLNEAEKTLLQFSLTEKSNKMLD